MTALAAAFVVGLLAFELFVRCPENVEVTRHTLRVPDLPGELRGARLAFVTDLHHRGTPGFRELWVRGVVRSLAPDMILLGGDMVDRGSSVPHFLDMVASWDPPLGTYMVLGNNEHVHMDTRAFAGQLEARGVRVLANQALVGGRGRDRWAVAGCDDPHTERDDLARTLRDVPRGTFTILLTHTPETFPEAVERGIPLAFAGHTHGGQVRLPLLGALWVHTPRTGLRYQTGLYREGDSALIVSKGVGTSAVPARLLCRPEVVLVTLEEA